MQHSATTIPPRLSDFLGGFLDNVSEQYYIVIVDNFGVLLPQYYIPQRYH